MNNTCENLAVENFVNMIREIVRDVLKEEMSASRVEKYYNGVIKAVDSEKNTATVDIGGLVLEYIPNKTGEMLYIEDKENNILASVVRVYSSSATLTDAYIGVKLN